jgi:serine O-acetyltransferase
VIDPDWQADLARYPRRPWLKEQSIWAIGVYRFGRRVDRRRAGLRRKILERFYWLAFRIVETLTGISIGKATQIGPGLKIWHFGNIFIHPESVIGANCTLRQGVTIGNSVEGGPLPVIEDDVEFGAYAQVFGGVRHRQPGPDHRTPATPSARPRPRAAGVTEDRPHLGVHDNLPPGLS